MRSKFFQFPSEARITLRPNFEKDSLSKKADRHIVFMNTDEKILNKILSNEI